jgi:lysophospholipase L1-like esterase
MPPRHKAYLLLLLTLAALAAGTIPCTPSACAATPEVTPAGGGAYEESYRKFEADAHTTRYAPPREGIIFVGSSTIYCWALELKKYFPDLPVWGFGFTGAKTPDVLAAIPRLLVPCRPRVVVYYCGDNDLGYPNVAPQVAVDGFVRFAAALRTALPRTRLVYLSIKPSPARAACWANVQTANTAVRAYCATVEKATYVDVATAMLDAKGAIRPELYEQDGLHMVGPGYQLWTSILRPELDKRYAEAAADVR